MSAYFITLKGCDDTTCLILELNEAEALVLQRIQEKSERKSHYSCQPKLYVRLATEHDEEDEDKEED